VREKAGKLWQRYYQSRFEPSSQAVEQSRLAIPAAREPISQLAVRYTVEANRWPRPRKRAAQPSFRMVLSYWNMAASLVTTGAIDANAFLAANDEVFATFSKVYLHLAELRAKAGEPGF
jgi:hypothetical protein